MNKEQAINKIIDIATAEIGYLEKKSNSQLDSKTANAGSGNYTKYWRDVYPQYQAQAWCACFVTWVLMKAFNKDDAGKLLKHYPYVYCPTLASMTPSGSKPQKGSIVIFYRSGTFAHTGIVISVSGNTITTIEGNASGASGITPNGGGVVKKSYNIKDLPGTIYFNPDYSIVAKDTDIKAGDTITATENILWRDTFEGKDVAWCKLPNETIKKKSMQKCASRLKQGKSVEVKEVKTASDGDTWVKTKSAWLCVIYKGKKRYK